MGESVTNDEEPQFGEREFASEGEAFDEEAMDSFDLDGRGRPKRAFSMEQSEDDGEKGSSSVDVDWEEEENS